MFAERTRLGLPGLKTAPNTMFWLETAPRLMKKPRLREKRVPQKVTQGVAESGSEAIESVLLPLGQGTAKLATREKLSCHQTLFAMAELDPLLISCDLGCSKIQFTQIALLGLGEALPWPGLSCFCKTGSGTRGSLGQGSSRDKAKHLSCLRWGLEARGA